MDAEKYRHILHAWGCWKRHSVTRQIHTFCLYDVDDMLPSQIFPNVDFAVAEHMYGELES